MLKKLPPKVVQNAPRGPLLHHHLTELTNNPPMIFFSGDFEVFCMDQEAVQCWTSSQKLASLPSNHRGGDQFMVKEVLMTIISEMVLMVIMLIVMMVLDMLVMVTMVLVMLVMVTMVSYMMVRCFTTLTAAAANSSHLSLFSSTSYIGQVMSTFCENPHLILKICH